MGGGGGGGGRRVCICHTSVIVLKHLFLNNLDLLSLISETISYKFNANVLHIRHFMDRQIHPLLFVQASVYRILQM